MSSVFLIEIHCTPRDVKQEDFLPVWLAELDFYLKNREEKGMVKHVWKCVGEYRMYIIIEGSAMHVDLMLLTTPLMVKHGQHTTVKVDQVLPYDKFVQNVTKFSPLPPGMTVDFGDADKTVDENASYFLFHLEMGTEGKERQDILRWGAEEWVYVMNWYKSGFILDGFKSVATRPLTVYYIVRPESANSLDDIFNDLPLFKHNGENIKLKLTPLKEGKFVAQKLREMTSSS